MRLLLKILLVIATGCNPKTENTKFYGYYDEAKTKPSMEGELNNEGNEEGLWKIYRPDGAVGEQGKFINGKHTGVWKYKLDEYIPNKVDWVSTQQNDFEFSVPGKSFVNISKDSIEVLFLDTLNRYLLSIKKFDKVNEHATLKMHIENEFLPVLAKKDVHYYKHERMVLGQKGYDLFQLTIMGGEEQKKATMWMAIVENENSFIDFSVTGSDEKSLTSKFYLGKVLLHSLYKGERIMHPLYDKVEEVIIMDEYKK